MKNISKDKIHWYCTVCNDISVEILRLVKNLKEKVQHTETKLEITAIDFTEKFTQLEVRLQKYTSEMNKQTEKLKAQEDKEFREMQNRCQLLENKFVDEHKVNNAENFRETVKKQMEEEMKKNEVTEKILEKKLLCSQARIQEMNQKLQETKSNFEEELDKESCRNNIIMYRIPESVSDSTEERKVMDKRFVLSLLTKMEVGIDEGDIKGAFRLGKWNSDENPQAVPRPVLVQFDNRTAKNLIMENLFN